MNDMSKTGRATPSPDSARLLRLPTPILFVLANVTTAYWRGADRRSDALFNTLLALRWMRNTYVFGKQFGYLPNYANPRSFCEKMQWRKLFDRNPLFPLLSDKIAVRDFVRDRVPEVTFPEIYWSGVDPMAIPFDDLRPPFVIKPNNRSGANIIVRDNRSLDRRAAVRLARKWMSSRPHNRRYGEWAYGQTRSQILIEEFLSDDGGNAPPPSYKILVFGGEVAFIYYSEGRRSGKGAVRGVYTRDWQLMPVDKWRRSGHVVLQGGMPRPKMLEDLISTASAIATGLDHVRVDLYLVGDRIYFSEATIYNYSGLEAWVAKDAEGGAAVSRSFDDAIGDNWVLPQLSRRRALKRALFNTDD